MTQSQPFAWYQLRNTLRLLASSAAEQLRVYPEFVPTASELLEEFNDFFTLVRDHARDRVSSAQWEALTAIDAAFEDMLQRDSDRLFTEEALAIHPDWQQVRSLASGALRAFEWFLEARDGEPPVDRLTLSPMP